MEDTITELLKGMSIESRLKIPMEMVFQSFLVDFQFQLDSFGKDEFAKMIDELVQYQVNEVKLWVSDGMPL